MEVGATPIPITDAFRLEMRIEMVRACVSYEKNGLI